MRHWLLVITVLALDATGCTNVDGVVVYRVDGVLTDHHGQPVVSTPVVPSLSATFVPVKEIGNPEDQNPGYTKTDDQGRFVYEVPAGGWGYTTFLGIPLSETTPPIPSSIPVVYLHVKRDGRWISITRQVPKADQGEVSPGIRYVRVGQVVTEDRK